MSGKSDERSPLEQRGPTPLDQDTLDFLVDEFMARLRAGERPTPEDYARRHPQLAHDILELFPVIAAMEQAKTQDLTTNVVRWAQPPQGARPERLGEFRIIREIGRGGMGVVYEAEQESLGRRVALKVLPHAPVMSSLALARFTREARVAASLQHPNIVPIYSVGQEGGFHFYAMQYTEALSWDKLVRWLAKHGKSGATPVLTEVVDTIIQSDPAGDVPLDEIPPRFGRAYFEEIAAMVSLIADGLHYAHSLGAIHRDIKPANLLLDRRGMVFLTDFGLMKFLQEEGITRSGEMTGTLRYMAPEQLDGKAEARSDIYSLGLTLYELAALKPAFNEQKGKLLQSILNGDIPPLRQIAPWAPAELEAIVGKATALSPDSRHQTAEELSQDLHRFIAHSSGQDLPEARPELTLEALGKPSSRRFAVLLAALLAVLAYIAFIEVNRHTTSDPAPQRAVTATPAPPSQPQASPKPEPPESRPESMNVRPPAQAFEQRPGRPRDQELPPRAYEICRGKKAGDTVQHMTPGGRVVATCVDTPQGLAARPNQPPGQRRK